MPAFFVAGSAAAVFLSNPSAIENPAPRAGRGGSVGGYLLYGGSG